MPVIAHNFRIHIAPAAGTASSMPANRHQQSCHHFIKGLKQTASHWKDLLRQNDYEPPLWILLIAPIIIIAFCFFVAQCVVKVQRRREQRQAEWDNEVVPAYDDEGLPGYEYEVAEKDVNVDKYQGLVELDAPPYEERATTVLPSKD